MLRKLLFLLVISSVVLPSAFGQKPKKQMYTPNVPVDPKFKVDQRIDNMSYWRRMASMGLVPVQQEIPAPAAEYGTSKLIGKGVMTEDSPDVPVTTQTSTQSENSIFVHPQDAQKLLQSNNSTPRPANTVYGANAFLSTDAGTTWGGSVNGAGGGNSGDPTTAISLSGRYYVNYIHSSGGQGISYSTDQGQSWTPVLIAPSPGGWNSLLDKNHMWIDNSPTSPFEGNLYAAWTNFGGNNDSEIEISYSTNEGLNWTSAVNISSAVNAGSHNQGVNIQTGPNGEVYAIWAIYDAFPQDEKAIGMAKSLDGGVTWQPATRIINNIRGIRSTGTGKNMRVNAFPTMAVDISNGPNRGAIYVTWPNIGVPGTNTGNDMDVYMIKSTDQGATWSAPIKVNESTPGDGKKHYFPWITCDPINGNLSVVYYDDRNVGSNQCEIYTSNSSDGGETWWDLKVSDVSFTPAPIAGLADSYFGDYLGNHARDGWVYPVWTDNRQGFAMTYVSPFVTGPPPNQPWLVYDSNSINDAEGNNNGLLDYGESALLNISVSNDGDTDAQSVTGVLTTDNTYVTITDGEASFGNIPVDQTVTINDAFAFTVANNIPDNENVTFTLASTDANDSTYYSSFIINAHAPAFKTGNIFITEITGNGNNRLDPGEDVTITISTMNSGDYRAYDVNGTLTSSSSYITISNPTIHWDSISPGPMSVVLAVYQVSVAPETPIGHFAAFNYQVGTTTHQFIKQFNYPVGLILEDWETGNFSNFEWQFAGSSAWSMTSEEKYEGNYSAVSGDTPNNGTSEVKLSYNVAQNDSISFYVKVSSEADYDFLKFYINNTLVEDWSGEISWRRVAFPVTAGQKVFRWVYSKDVYTTEGEDAAWIDFIVLPPLLQTTAYAGSDAVACESQSVLLEGSANNAVSTTWTTSGDGTFEDASALSTFYTPGGNDISNGNVTLTLTVNGPDGELKTDQMDITISSQASVGQLTDIAVCAGSTVPITGAASNYTQTSWRTSGNGTFTSTSELTTEYTPSAEDLSAGYVTIYLDAESESPCGVAEASMIVTFIPLPTVTVPASASICTGDAVEFPLTFTGTAPWSFQLSDGQVIETSDNPYTLVLSPETTTDYNFAYINDAICQNTAEGSFTVTVNPLPVVALTADTTICSTLSVNLTAQAEGDVSYNWQPGNMVTSSIPVDFATYGLGMTDFSVTVTDINTGCQTTESTSVTFEDCTGLSELPAGTLAVFPNPSNGQFNVRLGKTSAQQQFQLEIYDMSNKLVYSKSNVSLSLNGTYTVTAGSLAEGTYTLYLKASDKSYSTRLIIRK